MPSTDVLDRLFRDHCDLCLSPPGDALRRRADYDGARLMVRPDGFVWGSPRRLRACSCRRRRTVVFSTPPMLYLAVKFKRAAYLICWASRCSAPGRKVMPPFQT